MNERLDAAGDPELRRALLLARSQAEPLSADDAAAALGVHRNVARARLERLASAGFLSVFFARRGERRGRGAGRPAKLYEVAPQLDVVEFPERQFDELGQLLVERLDEPALRQTGREYGRALARHAGLRPAHDVRRGLQRLCERLGGSGFQVSGGDVSPERWTLSGPTWPVRPILAPSPRG